MEPIAIQTVNGQTESRGLTVVSSVVYIGSIIPPVASVAGREAGSSESASAFVKDPRENVRLR